MRKKRAFVTIAALNYAARAEVAVRTFEKFHPDIPFHFLVVDDVDGTRSKPILKTRSKPFFLGDLVEHFRDHSLPVSFYQMLFIYDVMEGSTAVKPYALLYLMEKYGYDEIIFLDPDTMATNSLDSVWNSFSSADLLLTPHLVTLGPFESAFKSEQAVLLAGVFNLGFLGVANTKQVREFLRWWALRLQRHCTKSVREGFFTDQRWIDAALGAFSKLGILRDPGLNVAHWNMHEREVWRDGKGVFRVGKSTLKFFHFSGFDPTRPTALSWMRPEMAVEDLGVLGDLVAEYGKLLSRHGQSKVCGLPYGMTQFSNGVEIPGVLREWARADAVSMAFENPYAVDSKDSFFNWLLTSSGTELCQLAVIVKSVREDIRQVYPSADPKTNATYMKWLVDEGAKELKFDPTLTKHLERKMSHFRAHL